MKDNDRRTRRTIAICLAALLALILLSFMVGRYPLTISDIWQGLSGEGESGGYVVFMTSRLPRVLTAVLIGMALSVSGCVYQGAFCNPMVSSDLLGASAGAGFGAVLGFLLGLPTAAVQALSFVCGILAVCMAAYLSRLASGEYGSRRVILVLCGIIVTALFQALISGVKYVADPYSTLPSIMFWLMGGLSYVTMDEVLFMLPPFLIGMIPLILVRWRINILTFGPDEARAMGVDVSKLRILVIACATLLTSASVAVGGMIGWVGLIVPHLSRMLVGSDQKKLVPCSMLLGGGFLLVVDDAARCLFAQDLPIGILTALIGVPVFAVLLCRGKRGFI